MNHTQSKERSSSDSSKAAADVEYLYNSQLSTQYLPRCLDMISAEEEIRRMELYFRGGAIDYLTAEQAAAVRAV